jgi:hypothetical protein
VSLLGHVQLGITCVVGNVCRAFYDVVPVACDMTFQHASADLAEKFPSSIFEKIVSRSKFE